MYDSDLQEAESKGEEYDRVKLLDIGADEAEKWDKKKKKKNPDPGFSGIDPFIYKGKARTFSKIAKRLNGTY